MIPILKKQYLKFLGAAAIMVVFLFALAIIVASLNSARSINTNSSSSGYAPGSPMGVNEISLDYQSSYAAKAPTDIAYESEFIAPAPTPGGYTSDLESFETTSYHLTGRVRDFENACDALAALKTDERFHFKTITAHLNSCNGTFFTEEIHVRDALSHLETFSGVTTNRATESMTRHREQIQGQNEIIYQQLVSVEQTLTEAEIAYNEIATFARAEKNVDAYSNAVDTKLRQIDQLTSRKISLTSQLNNLAQQAADLEERIGVVEISVNFTRSYTINPDKTSRTWERAWQALADAWTNFGTGITAYFGVFLLLVVQYSLYGLVLIVLAKFIWKLVRKIWQL